MKRMMISLALLTTLGSGIAVAEDLCHAPEAEWQPKDALAQKLQAEGWTVKSVKVDDGCYEVYGTNAKGDRMETYFDPKTFDIVKAD